MDSRSIVFLEVMIGIAVVGLAVFLIFLVVAYARRRSDAGSGEASAGEGAPHAPQWYEYLLALALLVVVVLVLLWQFASFPEAQPAAADWRGDTRSLIFFAVMLALAGLGALAFLVFLIARTPRLPPAPARAAEAAGAGQEAIETPAGARLLGLLVLALAYLLLNWLYLSPAQQYALMLDLLYPVSLAVALVLLFDKATRSWSVKGTAETVREWLLCDGIVLLLILGFLNLMRSGAGEAYASVFWDCLHIVLFFLAFWMLDRKATRYRFLVAYGYVALLPILLLIWRLVQAPPEAPGTEVISWWSTIWPFFFLALVFFVLEIIALVAARAPDKHLVPAIKDGVFVVLCGIVLIIAIPEAVG